MEVVLVHLSDLHFKNDAENRFRLERLREDIASLPLGSNVVTVFTGDLVQSGEQEQYDVLFELLLGPLIAADHQITIVPGNHDVQRANTDKALADARLGDRASSYLFSGNQIIGNPYADPVSSPLARYHELESLFDPYIERNFYGYLKRCGNVSIVGMNSSWLCLERDSGTTDRGALRVEPHILQKYAEALNPSDLKVLMLHHPFDWLEETTRDAVTSLATEHFDLVLFGHVHTADATSLVRNENGASFIQSHPLRADWSKGTNGYSLIRCDTVSRAVEITYRSYSKNRRKFVLGEDLAAGGVHYPTEQDRKHYAATPSLSTLAQKFQAAKPHDYVDWHRRNVRAKSSYIDSFITPSVMRVVSSGEEQWNEPPISLAKLFHESVRDQFVIAPADSGLSTCAFLTLQGVAERVGETGFIPTFFDAGETSINKATILRSMVQTCLVRYSTAEMERLANEGSLRLIVDGLNLSNAERFNSFREIMKRHFPKTRIVAFVRTEKVGQSVISPDFPALSIDEDEVFELGELQVEQIREVIGLHRKKLDADTANRLANQAVESLSQINEPVFPSTVAVLIETLVQDHDFRPINKARLLDRYVECLLGRFELEDVREGAFTSYDKIDLLSYVARILLEQNKEGLSLNEWDDTLSQYAQGFMIELPQRLLEEFEEKGLLVSEGGEITFRADYLFSYFVARQMKSDAQFANDVITNDGLYRHHSEVVYYGELEGTDTAAVLDELYNQIDSLEEILLEQYSRDGIDLTAEWMETANEDAKEVVAISEQLRTVDDVEPDPKVADRRDNQNLANVLRRRGIARRQDVVEAEARLLVAMRLYGQLIRNALHIAGQDKLRHLGKLYDAAETWVGFMCASRAHIGSMPVTVAGGVRFINRDALFDPIKSAAEFKYNAPNSVSRILAEAVRNPQLSVALRNVIPRLSPMGALFARDALLGLPSTENSHSYISSLSATDDETLVTASLRTLKRQYLESGRNSEMRDYTTSMVNDVRRLVGEKSLGNTSRLEKQRLVRDLKANASDPKRNSKDGD